MSALTPMAFYGLEVPAGDVAIPARPEIPSAFRITMAAIDPSAEPEGEAGAPQRATLKIMRQPLGLDDYNSEDDDEDDFDAEEMERILAEEADEDSDEDEDEDEDIVGGPSDPAKSKKAKKAAARAEIMKLLQEDGMDVDSKPNGNYNQPLDITIGEDEEVYFKVSGTHSIFLTGNYVDTADEQQRLFDPEDDSDEDYDLDPDEDELDDEYDSEADELDDMEDPRITELDESEEEAPKLIESKKTKATKGNKRGAETLDEMISTEAGTANGEPALSKKQQKKLKKNDGSAAAVKEAEAPSSTKSDKTVTFAKKLEQGPTPSKAAEKTATKADSKATGIKMVQGVTIDDKKAGTGPAAKSGDRIGMRYIGKLQKDGKVFDSNKKGKPFSFKLGAGEVIKGWDIGVAGMATGGERRITIPAHLAYGSKGVAGIPPNSTLIFDVKLIEINKGK
nr:fk506-binding protein 4 [Quercus suber]